MSTTPRSLGYAALAAFVLLVGCDSASDEDCLEVTPDEAYVLSGTAMTTNFAPASKRYTVRNSCSSDVDLSVEEDARWLDVDIAGAGGAESGVLRGGGSINVDVGVVYGSDNPERLDQLAAGSYTAELRFVDETNDSEVVRSVQLTVNAP